MAGKRKKTGTVLRRMSSILFIIILTVSLFYLGSDIRDIYRVKLKYIRIRNDAGDEKLKTIDFDKLCKINPDIVAWIEIENTGISYPVVRTKSNEEYLYKDIEGNYSIYGSIFLDERLHDTDLKENENNIIYGHNMGRWTDVMFGGLKEYLNSSYLKGHERLTLYTRDATLHYTVTSVMHADISSDVYETDIKGDYGEWIRKQMEKSIYPCVSEKSLNECKRALTLSTCDTTHDTGEKIVVFCTESDD